MRVVVFRNTTQNNLGTPHDNGHSYRIFSQISKAIKRDYQPGQRPPIVLVHNAETIRRRTFGTPEQWRNSRSKIVFFLFKCQGLERHTNTNFTIE